MTVSYTHLDVYKRQVRACSMIILPDTSKETITSDDVTFDFFDTQDPSEYHIVYEVDVYKRQGLNSRI